jgi:hypothetical protein
MKSNTLPLHSDIQNKPKHHFTKFFMGHKTEEMTYSILLAAELIEDPRRLESSIIPL